MTRTKTWWFDDPNSQVMFLGAGASSYRGLRANFLAPRTLIGSHALQVFFEQAEGIFSLKRALIITDPWMAGEAEKVAGIFRRFDFEAKTWSGVGEEAPLSSIREGAAVAKEYAPTLLVAFGGGSVLDAAKALYILYEKENQDLTGVHPLEPLGLRQKALMLAIPTTSGTGSEATMAAVLTDEEEDPPVKVSLMHPEIVPEFAVIDPRFVLGMPPRLAMGSGLDVLTHAAEAYFSTWSNDYTEPLSVRAIKLVLDYLPRSVKSGKDREARFKMHIASNLAGLAFSNAVPGIAHSAGHSLGKLFNIHHGVAVGLFLPYALQYHSAVTSKGDQLARELEIPYQEGAGTAAVVEHFRKLYRKVGGPLSGMELVPEDRFIEHLDELCRIAEDDPTSLVSVRPINREGFRYFMKYAYYGNDIDY